MAVDRKLKALGLILLSILLIGANSFAADVKPNRRPYIEAAYEGFFGALNFVAGNEAFVASLSAEEKTQFQQLGEILMPRQLRLGPAATAFSNQTSQNTRIQLHFSDQRADFIIPPDKIERTARMDGQIWFNNYMINNPETQFNLLDAMQILFHEFSHALGEKENQEISDSLAAKMVETLRPYYKEKIVMPEFKYQTLILPYLMVPGGPVDFQMEPLLVFDLKGQALAASVNVDTMKANLAGYTANSVWAVEYKRIDLSPRLTEFQGQFMMTWTVESKSFLVEANQINYVNLYTATEKIIAQLPLPPVTSPKTIYQIINPQELFNLTAKATQTPTKIVLKDYSNNDDHYQPSFEAKWIEKLSQRETKNGRIYFEGIIQSATAIKQIGLLGQSNNKVVEFPGDIQKLTADFYKLSFSVPEQSTEFQKLKLIGVSLNSLKRLDFESSLNIPLKLATEKMGEMIALRVWHNNQWQSIQDIQTGSVSTDEIKMQIDFKNTPKNLNHIEINWVTEELILSDNKSVGERIQNRRELIPKENLSQRRHQDLLTVEFSSKQFSKYLPDEKGSLGFSAKDSGRRTYTLMQFFDTNLNSTPVYTPNWKKVFALTKPRPQAVLDCKSLFTK